MPIALCVIGLAGLLSSGCGREGGPSDAERAASPTGAVAGVAARMNDPAYRQALSDGRHARAKLVQMRAGVVEKMTALVEAAKARLGTADEAVLKAELEKDPEWVSLFARCNDLNTAIGESRRDMLAVVRARLAAGKGEEISK